MSKVWAEIVTKIGENDSSLTIVDISDKNLGSRGSAKLGSALKKNRVVSELDVGLFFFFYFLFFIFFFFV